MEYIKYLNESYKVTTFYRGTVPGETKRIKEPFSEAKGKIFVARKIESAKNYGEQIQTIQAKPNAKIWKLLGKRKPPNGAIESVSGGAINNVNKIIQKAIEAGYDAISFSHDDGIGTVIINNDSFIFSNQRG
jgi:hypothetical protein